MFLVRSQHEVQISILIAITNGDAAGGVAGQDQFDGLQRRLRLADGCGPEQFEPSITDQDSQVGGTVLVDVGGCKVFTAGNAQIPALTEQETVLASPKDTDDVALRLVR